MALRVAFDLDGTIADMEGALQREAEKLFGPNVLLRPPGSEHLDAPPSVEEAGDDATKVIAKPEKKEVLSGRRLRQLWEHVAGIENFWTTLREIEPGSVARIGSLRNAHRMEVMFLTQRPETAGEITQLQTQRWLEAHGFELPSVFVLRGSRGLAASALQMDVVVDDRPENCLEVITESKARPLLVWREPLELLPPGARRLGIEPVLSVGDALRAIEAILADAPKSTFVSRLRNAIGI
jgi:hypothetical protein